jgi:biotin carboxyl carrier protein
MKYLATVDEQQYRVGLDEPGIVTVDDLAYAVDLQSIDGGFHYSLLVGPDSHEVFVERCDDVCFVTLDERRFRVQIQVEGARQAGRQRGEREEPGMVDITSPMPGMVVAVLVQEGQEVRTGEGLLILEAMKMENEIRATRNGIIEQIHVAPGQRVRQSDTLARIGSPENRG